MKMRIVNGEVGQAAHNNILPAKAMIRLVKRFTNNVCVKILV